MSDPIRDKDQEHIDDLLGDAEEIEAVERWQRELRGELLDDDAEPLVAGGQGRSGEEVADSAIGCLWVVIFCCLGWAVILTIWWCA